MEIVFAGVEFAVFVKSVFMNSGTHEQNSKHSTATGTPEASVTTRPSRPEAGDAKACEEATRKRALAKRGAFANWRADLSESRRLEQDEKEGYGFFLGWFENWRLGGAGVMKANRESAVTFWKTQVLAKPRERWQLDQWGAAMKWYLRWLELCKNESREVQSVPERMKAAVANAAARKGHAVRTRASYGSWVARYGAFAGTEERAMDPAVAREFLSALVQQGNRSYATQHQALCALAFFFKQVCGMKEVDLRTKRKESPRKEPVVLNVPELLALIDKLSAPYRLPAQLQAGSGVRREELVTLRIKDIDLEARTVTVRRGKRQKDRVTVLPESLVEPLERWKAKIRELWEVDRAAGRPGVALPGALERNMPKAGERWEWFWLFPAAKESRDPESGVRRRHHLHANVYSQAISRAAQKAGIEKWVTSHSLRHTFATMLLKSGTDIRTVQELLGHEDVTTTEGYTHAATGVGKAGVKSPLDALGLA